MELQLQDSLDSHPEAHVEVFCGGLQQRLRLSELAGLTLADPTAAGVLIAAARERVDRELKTARSLLALLTNLSGQMPPESRATALNG